MKTLNFYKLTLLFFAVTLITSCVKNDDFDVPSIEVQAPDLSGEAITIDALYDLYLQELIDNENSTLTIEQDYYITGYVISNDEQGNFFEELILQDLPENPTRGVRVMIDVNPLFITYEFGRQTHVQVQGLTVGIDGGVLTLGVGSNLDKISEASMLKKVKRDVEVATIVPMDMSFSDFSTDKTNLYIRVNDVQFNRNDVLGDDPKSYSGEPDDSFDGERVLESCTSGLTTIFSTSTFADFTAVQMSAGRGSIEGVLTLNFFGETFNLVANSLDAIQLEDTNRCDPVEIDCGLADSTGSNIIFSEFFESFSDGQTITGNGWTNYSQEGSQEWEAYFSGGTNSSLGISCHIGSFLSGDDSTINWLITPQINFDAQDGETINFKTSNSFSDGSTLEFLFSSDWDGTPENISGATWDLLPAATIVSDDDFFGDWIDSENVDLSCISGTGYIAWKYIGSGDSDVDGTYELDEIEIKSN